MIKIKIWKIYWDEVSNGLNMLGFANQRICRWVSHMPRRWFENEIIRLDFRPTQHKHNKSQLFWSHVHLSVTIVMFIIRITIHYIPSANQNGGVFQGSIFKEPFPFPSQLGNSQRHSRNCGIKKFSTASRSSGTMGEEIQHNWEKSACSDVSLVEKNVFIVFMARF